MSSRHLRRTISGIGGFVAVVIAISLPLLYAVVSFWNTTEDLSFQARLNSGYVAKYVYQNGSMWPFHKVRLNEVIELNKAAGASAVHRIYAADGTLVLEDGPSLATPTAKRSAPILVRGVEVGWVEVDASLRPLLLNTGLAALFSVLLGAAAYYPFRVLPVRLLDRTVSALERRAEVALSTMAQGLTMYDADDRLVLGNRRFLEIYNLPEEAIRPGVSFLRVLELSKQAGNLPHRTAQEAYDERRRTTSAREKREFVQALSDGRVVAISVVPTTDGGWLTTYNDITERERMTKLIEEQRSILTAALTNMPHGLCMFDADKRLVVSNARYAEMYDLPEHLVRPGTHLEEIVGHRRTIRNAPVDIETYIAQLEDFARRGGTTAYDCELEDGRTVRVNHNPTADGGYVASHEDITEIIKAEAQIKHMAHHDALTGLFNRVAFGKQVERALKRVGRGEKLAVLYLDLDRFKSVNDTLGHPTGDELLRVAAQRLRECVRDTDVVARLGGDEFTILEVGLGEPHQSSALAERVIAALSKPYNINGHQIVIGTSVGIALAPEDGSTPDQLLRSADMALYKAKSEGRGTYHFFEAGMDARMQARRSLELDLREALEKGEFEVYYQPVIQLDCSEVRGFEALLRWHHPKRGMVSPAEFIPVAEEIGLLGPIGAWVLKQACAEAVKWPPEVSVAVNLSSSQFRGKTLLLDVASALGTSGLAPHRLELEITETVILQETETTLSVLNQLRVLGVRIAMDDFGTGYSSLSYLRKFPFDKIKIDQSFVRDLVTNAESVAIIRAITALGTSLGMTTTAEGVETEDQLATLRSEGCNEVQGFLFSRPRPAGEALGLIQNASRQARLAA